MHIFETVIAAEAADRLAFLGNEFQGRMLFDGLPELFQFTVDGLLAERWVEFSRVEKDVDVFGKSLNQIPPLRQTGAALENDLVPAAAWMIRSASVT